MAPAARNTCTQRNQRKPQAKAPAVRPSTGATACTKGSGRKQSHNQDTQAPTLSPAAFDGSCSKEHLHPKKSEKPQAKAPAVRPSTGATACTKGSGRKHRTIKIPTSPRPCQQQHSMAPAARNTCTQGTRRSHRPRPQPCDPAQERQPAPREVARSIAHSRYPSPDLASSSIRWLLQEGSSQALKQAHMACSTKVSTTVHEQKESVLQRPRSRPQTSTWDQSRPDQCDGGGHDNSSFGGGGVRIRLWDVR